MNLKGIPTQNLSRVLATGTSDVGYVFVSLSGRDPEGRDAEYIEWHSLDHRPEQYRLPGLRNSLRLVSTPECRAARAANSSPYDLVDHVMTYQFTGAAEIPGFNDLGHALAEGGRMPHRLPSIDYMTADLSGKLAADYAVAGADVIPWRPVTGAYLLIEEGQQSPAELLGVPGIAGVWWYSGALAPEPYNRDARGRQITYCYLDRDPVDVAALMADTLHDRWAKGDVTALLAAPFYAVVPFEWDKYLPY